MAVLAFVILAHEPAEDVVALVDMLLSADPTCYVALHYDGNTSREEFAKLEKHLALQSRVILVEPRIRCDWGRFSLVEATLRALRALRLQSIEYSHAYLLSASCWPIRPMSELRAFLDSKPEIDFIESSDEEWILAGLRAERYALCHPFSFRRHHWLFMASLKAQRLLGWRRALPRGLEARFGSQWWCLRRETIEKILDWVSANSKSYSFFRQVWIPDEMFFQTVLNALPDVRLSAGNIPTLYRFNAYGKPMVFYDDHLEYLKAQPHYFARKIARSATRLRQGLAEHVKEARGAEQYTRSAVPVRVGEIQISAQPPARLGQVFEPTSSTRKWTKTIRMIQEPCAILYGQPERLKGAIEALRVVNGVTALGRIFSPQTIEFGSGRSDFDGISSSDTELRDYDRPLFLSRVLRRTDNFLIFALAPGDYPMLERELLVSDTLIGLPLLDPDIGFEAFWVAALSEEQLGKIDQADEKTRLGLFKKELETIFGPKHVSVIDSKLLSGEGRKRQLVLPTGTINEERWACLAAVHGTAIQSLRPGLECILGRQLHVPKAIDAPEPGV